MNINTDYRVRAAIADLVRIVTDAYHYKTTPDTSTIEQGLDNFAEAILDVAIQESLTRLKLEMAGKDKP